MTSPTTRRTDSTALQIIRRLERDNSRLRRLLAPFAKEAANWADTVPDRYRPGITKPKSKFAHGRAHFTIGNLRAAQREVDL